jgi:rhodanese-related sulfurtransferase
MDIPEVDVTAAHRGGEGVALIDVRELDEWEAGRAPGALHLPMSNLKADQLPDAPVLHCICRSGGRSAKVTEALRRAGYDAYNVAGGMQAWEAAGFPVEAAAGPGTVI